MSFNIHDIIICFFANDTFGMVNDNCVFVFSFVYFRFVQNDNFLNSK